MKSFPIPEVPEGSQGHRDPTVPWIRSFVRWRCWSGTHSLLHMEWVVCYDVRALGSLWEPSVCSYSYRKTLPENRVLVWRGVVMPLPSQLPETEYVSIHFYRQWEWTKACCAVRRGNSSCILIFVPAPVCHCAGGYLAWWVCLLKLNKFLYFFCLFSGGAEGRKIISPSQVRSIFVCNTIESRL